MFYFLPPELSSQPSDRSNQAPAYKSFCPWQAVEMSTRARLTEQYKQIKTLPTAPVGGTMKRGKKGNLGTA